MEKKRHIFSLLYVLVFLLSACAPTTPVSTQVPAPSMIPEPTATAEPTETTEPPLTYEIPDIELPLSEDGPYHYSIIFDVNYVDPKRDNREVLIFIFYPSVDTNDNQPDVRGAPFPLIICDHKMANEFGKHMASHGYVVAGIKKIDYHHPWDENFFEQPLDYVFVLNQLAENPPETLTGIIDTDHVGVWGYSFGGMNSITLSGARVDPEYYFENCKDPENIQTGYEISSIQMMCGPYQNWDDFVQKAGPELTEGEDGLWKPMTDERILALIPMSGEGEMLFGPKGLAPVDKAIIVTAGTNEATYEENYRIFEELGTSQKAFISFVHRDHGMIYSGTPTKQMRHLAIAFFSYHLKGYEDYAQYFSEEYISEIEGLAWGWYED